MKQKSSAKKIIGIIFILLGITTLIVGIILFMFSHTSSILWTLIISVFLNVAGINIITHKTKSE